MKILRKTSKGIRPEFWGWSSYTQQACESGMFSLFFFFFCSTKAGIQTHVDNDLLCFHRGEKNFKKP